MRRDLKLGGDIDINENTPFFGSNADIDSLDILLLLGSIEKEFGLRIPSEAIGREVFQNVGTLVGYVEQNRAGRSGPVAGGGPGSGGSGRLRGPAQRGVRRFQCPSKRSRGRQPRRRCAFSALNFPWGRSVVMMNGS